jgi:hypothetical protein
MTVNASCQAGHGESLAGVAARLTGAQRPHRTRVCRLPEHAGWRHPDQRRAGVLSRSIARATERPHNQPAIGDRTMRGAKLCQFAVPRVTLRGQIPRTSHVRSSRMPCPIVVSDFCCHHAATKIKKA